MPHPLAGYLPRLLIRRLASGPPLAGPEAGHIHAAVLLSDIQGFTALVEEFSGAGRAGLEQLTWALNGYVADLVDAVYAHGGDVLYIAGDAFYCCWPVGDPAELPDAVAAAAEAGREIQTRLHGRPVGRGRQFATRLAIGAGELVVAFAGGVRGRWEPIVTGEAFDDVVAVGHDAAPGEVTLSPRGRALSARRAGAGEGRRPGTAGVASIPGTEALDLRPYLPAAVLDRMLLPQAEWLAEIRQVSVVLAGLPPLGLGPEELARTDACVRAFQEVVHRFEGTVKLDVDDKGVLLLAVFGLPPLAHEDDAERALHAGRALHDALAALGAAGGVGVATGRAFCGAFGSDLRRDYMLRGDVINLAARLMHATPHAVTCDQATVQSARGRFTFEPLPPIRVKGRTQPVPIYLPIGRAEPTRSPRAGMIGRVEERAVLEGRLAAFRSGTAGGVVLIEAEAGLGKSTLVADLMLRAGESGLRTVTAAADAIERATAYYAWRGVFTELFGLAGADAGTVPDRIAGRLAALPQLQRLAPLLGAVLPVGMPDNELTAEMTGDVRADNTRRLLAGVLHAACRDAPLLLIVEDAHWLDSGSWALLLEVLRSAQPLLAVVTARPGMEEQPEYRQLAGLAQTGGSLLRLDALSSDEMLALVHRRLGVAEIPPQLAALVAERVAGHPFFAEELLQTMLESGVVRVEEGRCEVGDLRGIDLPTTVEGVILSRLDRLSPSQQLCLKVAAVIGRVFRSEAVGDAYPVEAERTTVPDHLEALRRLELTLREVPESDQAYLFKHVITRDVTYELMPLAQRRPLHRAVAEWYQRTFAADLSPYYALLAYHWGCAADGPATAAYLELAGEDALRGGAFQEALLFFSQAVALADGGAVAAEPLRRAGWEKGLGTAHYFLGQLSDSRKYLERAVSVLDRPVPGGARVSRSLLAAAATQAAHRLRPDRYLARRGGERPVLDQAVDCYKILGQIYYLDGEPAPRLAYLTLRGLNVGEEAGPSPNLARILTNMGVLTGLVGMKRWGDWYARQAIAMAEREGHFAAAAYVWHIHALGEAQAARWQRARAANDEALGRIQELGDYNLEAEAWVVRATIALCEGDYASAPEAWGHARRLAERNGNAQILCWSLLDEVDTLLGRDDTAGAAPVLARALAIATAETDGSSTLDKHRALALTRLREGRVGEAVAAADVVLDTVSRQPPTGYHWADFLASAVEVHLSAWESGEGNPAVDLEQRAARGCGMLRRLARNFWNVRPRAALLEGVRQRIRGRPEVARRHWEKAESLAAKMDMPYERARALLELARSEPHPIRQTRLDEAAAIFERLGALHGLRLVAEAQAG